MLCRRQRAGLLSASWTAVVSDLRGEPACTGHSMAAWHTLCSQWASLNMGKRTRKKCGQRHVPLGSSRPHPLWRIARTATRPVACNDRNLLCRKDAQHGSPLHIHGPQPTGHAHALQRGAAQEPTQELCTRPSTASQAARSCIHRQGQSLVAPGQAHSCASTSTPQCQKPVHTSTGCWTVSSLCHPAAEHPHAKHPQPPPHRPRSLSRGPQGPHRPADTVRPTEK